MEDVLGLVGGVIVVGAEAGKSLGLVSGFFGCLFYYL